MAAYILSLPAQAKAITNRFPCYKTSNLVKFSHNLNFPLVHSKFSSRYFFFQDMHLFTNSITYVHMSVHYSGNFSQPNEYTFFVY